MCKVLLLVCVLVLAVSSVHAATSTQTATLTGITDGTSSSFTFTKFDGTLGALTQVVLTLHVDSTTLNLRAVNSDPSNTYPLTSLTGTTTSNFYALNDAADTALAQVQATATFSPFTAITGTIPKNGDPAFQVSGTTFCTGDTGRFCATEAPTTIQSTQSSTPVTDAPTLGQFTGVGAGVTLQNLYNVQTSASGSVSSGGTFVTYGASGTASITATLTYTYTATTGGDPQFVGFQGQRFQIHGIPDEHFSLISTADYYVNSRFVYMANGLCNYNETECFSHPGTYIGQIGFVADKYQVKVASGPHAAGLTVYVNDKLATIGTRVKINNSTHIHVISHNRVSITTTDFIMTAVNSDLFLNLGVDFTNGAVLHAGHVQVTIPASATPAQADRLISQTYPEFAMHGLLGQTWRNIHWPQNKLYQGEPSDYQVSQLFSPEFLFTQYQHQA